MASLYFNEFWHPKASLELPKKTSKFSQTLRKKIQIARDFLAVFSLYPYILQRSDKLGSVAVTPQFLRTLISSCFLLDRIESDVK